MKSRARVLAFLGAILCLPAFGDNIRGLVVEEVRLASDAGYEKTVAIALEEAAAVHLEGDTRFLRGVRLELRLSNLLKQHFDSFALAVYSDLAPEPRLNMKSFQGKRVFFQYMPYLNRVYLFIQFAGMEGPEEDLPAGTFRFEIAREDFPILVAVLPLMKGIPDTVAESKFFLTAKPVLEKKGLFELILRYPPGMEDEPVTVFLNERELETVKGGTANGKRELAAGLHTLRIQSAAFRQVSASFTIESGKTSTLEIVLEKLASLLSIEAPQNAEVYLDGEKITDFAARRFPVEEGGHQVRIKIGDYSLTKKFTVQQGRDYHISCVFDILIGED